MAHSDKVRVAVIGVGGHGKNRHLIPYSKLADVELVAVADPDQRRREEAADTFGLKGYADYLEMLDRESLDAVSAVTPTGLHASIAADALKRGVHVLVDKPLGANLNEAVEAARTAKHHGRKLMVGYWSRFSPALEFGVEALRDGLLGEPYYAYGYLVRRRGIPGVPTFVDKKLSGGRGALLDIGCYIVDNALSMVGFRRPISASGKVYTAFGRNPEEVGFNWGRWDPSSFSLEDFAAGFVRFEGGLTMAFEVGWAANVAHTGEAGRLHVLGDRGGIDASGDEAIRQISLHTRTKKFLTDTKPILKEPDLSLEMVKAFIRCVKDDLEPPVSAQQSVLLHSIIDGIYSSSEKNEEVKLTIPEI